MDANWYNESGTTPDGALSLDDYDYIGHDMEFKADNQITDLINIELEDTLVFTRDPSHLDTYSNEIIKHKYLKNIFTPRLYYQFQDRFGLGIGYSRLSVDYDSTEDEDSIGNRGLLNVHYNMNSKNSLDLQYQFWKKDYDKTTPDYTSQQTLLTFVRELKYYQFAASAGYHLRTFDESTQKDMGDVVWSLEISGDRPQFKLGLSQNYNDTAYNNEYYKATKLDAMVGHLFLEKINVQLNGYYQRSEYQLTAREDDRWTISCSIDYLRNDLFSIGLESGYESRDSSEDGGDFNNTYILIGMKFNFNLGSK